MKIKLSLLSLLAFFVTLPSLAQNNGLNKKTASESSYVGLLNSRSNGDNILLTYNGPESMFITVSNPTSKSKGQNYNIELPVPTVQNNKISIVGISTNTEAVLLEIYMLESKTLRCDLKVSSDERGMICNNIYNMDVIGFAKSMAYVCAGQFKYDTNNNKAFTYLKMWMKKFTMYTEK